MLPHPTNRGTAAVVAVLSDVRLGATRSVISVDGCLFGKSMNNRRQGLGLAL